jgi:hypothetical protein
MGWVVDAVLQGLRGVRVVVRRKWSFLRLADLAVANGGLVSATWWCRWQWRRLLRLGIAAVDVDGR